MATKFMKCAKHFSNLATSQHLKPSQMIELLALPAEETEKFLASKAAEGTPVEEMTVKILREKIAEYKAKMETFFLSKGKKSCKTGVGLKIIDTSLVSALKICK